MSHHADCPHCHRRSLRRPPVWGPLLVALAWSFVAALLFLSALIGPILIFVLPFVFATGASVVVSAHDLAFAPPECERCGKVVVAEAAPAAARVLVPRAAPRLA